MRRLLCGLRGHRTRTAMIFPEAGIALKVTRCRCGHIYKGSGRELQFPMPKERMRRIA